jgi:hypothetical protein
MLNKWIVSQYPSIIELRRKWEKETLAPLIDLSRSCSLWQFHFCKNTVFWIRVQDLLFRSFRVRLRIRIRILWTLKQTFKPLFQLSVWCEKCVAARHYAVIFKQLLFSNDRNRVRWVVLGLSEDGTFTDLVENLSVNSLKGDLSNAITFNLPLFSLVNTFTVVYIKVMWL